MKQIYSSLVIRLFKLFSKIFSKASFVSSQLYWPLKSVRCLIMKNAYMSEMISSRLLSFQYIQFFRNSF